MGGSVEAVSPPLAEVVSLLETSFPLAAAE
jgi:hypothetical protein